jgi:hypothetical protein
VNPNLPATRYGVQDLSRESHGVVVVDGDTIISQINLNFNVGPSGFQSKN